MTEPVSPDIGQVLQEALLVELRKRLTDDEIVKFMKRHDEILEEFLRETNEARAGYCPKCGHSWAAHDTKLEGNGEAYKPSHNPYGYKDVYECNAYMGMGDWCGCEERSRRPRSTPPEEPTDA